MAKNRRSRKDRKNTRRRNMRKNRTMKGGGWGFTGSSSIPGTPGTVSNPQVFSAIGDCRAAEPGYWIPQSSYSTYQKGLPGMSGGKRTRKNRRNMKGGRYGFAPEMIPGVTPNGAAWWAGTYGPIQRIACEGSTPNPLNPSPHTPSTQPLPVASSSIPMPSQSGGAQTAPATVGVGNVDSMYYYAPTAGYANQASTWKDSVGAPVLIQNPFAAREMNQACLTTGGPPPLTGALQQMGGGLFNTITSGLTRVTNTVKGATKGVTNKLGITQKNKNTTAGIGNAYVVTNSLTAPAPSTTTTNTGLNSNPFKGGKRKAKKSKKSRKHRKGSRKH